MTEWVREETLESELLQSLEEYKVRGEKMVSIIFSPPGVIMWADYTTDEYLVWLVLFLFFPSLSLFLIINIKIL